MILGINITTLFEIALISFVIGAVFGAAVQAYMSKKGTE